MTVAAASRWGSKQAADPARWAERPPGSNVTPVWDDFHAITGQPAYQRQPWCGAELIDIAHHGGLDLPAGFISVLWAQQWAEEKSRWSRGSAGTCAGDALVIGGPGVHIEYARSAARADGSVLVQGGNTSSVDLANGNAVAIKVRQAHEIYGRIRLHDLYPGGAGNAPKPTPIDKRPADPQYRPEERRGSLHLWEHGPRIERMQELLGVPSPDGYFGRETARAVGRFNHAHGLSAPATVATPKMLRLLEEAEKPRPRFKTLRRGMKGARVRKLQQRLIAHGYLPAETGGWRNDDGDFGPVTDRAVKKVERAHGWPVNGTAGGRVWKALT